MNKCGLILPCQNHTLFQTKKAKSITLFLTKNSPQTIPFRAAHTHIAKRVYTGVPLTFVKVTCFAQARLQKDFPSC